MIKKEDEQTIHEWIQKILLDAGRADSQPQDNSTRIEEIISTSDKSCMDVHKDILQLEGDFQVYKKHVSQLILVEQLASLAR